MFVGSSPSRTYVAMCHALADGRRFSFMKFTIPPQVNNSVLAAEVYFNAAIYHPSVQVERVITIEEYQDLQKVGPSAKQLLSQLH